MSTIKSISVPDQLDQHLSGDLADLDDFAEYLAHAQRGGPRRLEADASNIEQGLGKLVLTLIELIRQLLEKQAIRRMEGGSLSEEQIERMGEAFLKLEVKMAELKEAFGLVDEDLNLNLGPLGDLM